MEIIEGIDARSIPDRKARKDGMEKVNLNTDMNLQTDYLQHEQENDILRFILNNGMVNISDVQNSMEVMKRKELSP